MPKESRKKRREPGGVLGMPATTIRRVLWEPNEYHFERRGVDIGQG